MRGHFPEDLRSSELPAVVSRNVSARFKSAGLNLVLGGFGRVLKLN